MPSREEADEQRVDQVALPHNRLMHTCTQGFNKVATALNLGGECADVYGFHMVLLRLSVYLSKICYTIRLIYRCKERCSTNARLIEFVSPAFI